MKEETRRWFIEKVAQNPEYLERTFLPALERAVHKAEDALRQSIRADDLPKIKYRQGWVDGAQECVLVLDGLRLSEGKKPAEPGLMARIFAGG